jgi:hypothetical protein
MKAPRKQRPPTDDKPDVIEFEKIDREVNLLLRRLRGVCPCCIARGLIYRGSHLLADVAGGEEVVEVCMDIADAIERPDDVSETQH